MSRNSNSERRSWRNNGEQLVHSARISCCVQLIVCISSFSVGNGFVLAQEQQRAEQSYFQNCALCHADDGTGAMPGAPDLLTNSGWAKDTDAVLLKRIQQGIKTAGSPGMPPNAGNPALTERDVLLSIRYLRSLLAGNN